jgi:hypothetical protein
VWKKHRCGSGRIAPAQIVKNCDFTQSLVGNTN